MAEPGWRQESQNGGASADGVQGGSLGFPGRVEKGPGWGLPEPPRSPAGSHPPCPCSSVPGGAADIPVHHPGGGHHHGALCHRRTSGARRQAQRGGGRHGVLHVLPQLAPLSGRCRDRTAPASAQRLEGTVDILPILALAGTTAVLALVACSGLPRPLPLWGSGAPPQL